MKLRKKPMELEGLQFKTADQIEVSKEQYAVVVGFENDELTDWMGEALANDVVKYVSPACLAVEMYDAGGKLKGVVYVHPGDWIVRGPTGEIYPVPADKFDLTYEAIS